MAALVSRSKPTSAESELDEIQLAVNGADLARNVEWLPAIEQFGEGIFLHVAPEFLKRGLSSQRFEPRMNLRDFDPVTVWLLNVKDLEVAIPSRAVQHLPCRFQSIVLRIVLFRLKPSHWRIGVFVPGVQFPFHGGHSDGAASQCGMGPPAK